MGGWLARLARVAFTHVCFDLSFYLCFLCVRLSLSLLGGEHKFHLPSGKMVFRHFLVHLSLSVCGYIWVCVSCTLYVSCTVCAFCIYVHVKCVCTCMCM